MSLNQKRVISLFIISILVISIVVVHQVYLEIKYDPAPSKYAQPKIDYGVKKINENGEVEKCRVGFSFPQSVQEDPHFLNPMNVVENKGDLFRNLPIPTMNGFVFSGWFRTQEFAESDRINGSKVVDCDESNRIQLYGKWISSGEVKQIEKGVPILLFHQFDDECEPGNEANCLSLDKFKEFMKYIKDENYYLLTWEELLAYIDKKLVVPEKTVIITDDDASNSWFEKAEPVIEQNELIATSFVITSQKDFSNFNPNFRISYRSHSDSLHSIDSKTNKALIHKTDFNSQVIDFERSKRKLGDIAQVFAFPFGQYDRILTNQALKQNGFLLALTIENKDVFPGDDPLRLGRRYVLNNWTLEDLKNALS